MKNHDPTESLRIKENDHEFVTLHQRLREDLKPVGPLEEMLVDQIVTAHWRGRRVLKAEAAEIALSVDNGNWDRSRQQPGFISSLWAASGDPDYDSNQEMSLSGGGGGSFNQYHNAIYDATMAYTLANNGQTPSDPNQITPYLKRPVDGATMQKYFSEIVSNIAADPPSTEEIKITPALMAYKAANNGQYPKNPSDLSPYATTPEQQAALQKLEQQSPAAK